MPDLNAAFPADADVHAQGVQEVLLRVERADQAFFRRVQAGETPGSPRFQGRERYHRVTYPQCDHGARLDNGTLVRSKIGRSAGRWSRPWEGAPKTVTVSREADGWYVGCSCAAVPIPPLPPTGRETGIDVGLQVFRVTAEGEVVENPRHYRTGEKRLSFLRRMARRKKDSKRRQKDSKRRKKAVVVVAKAHQQVRRQRADHHHKTALALLRQDDVLYREDLPIANRVRNRHLAKSIADAGWAQFRSIRASIRAGKAVWAGKRVGAIPAQYTSQECSGCGVRVPKSRSVRTHVCPSCGLVLDRDENAARNILRAGQARQGAVALAAVVS